jgi:predicted dehydrogenase
MTVSPQRLPSTTETAPFSNGYAKVAEQPVPTAVVGYGYWGPNLVRNIAERPELALAGLCELDSTRTASFQQRYPQASVWCNYEELLCDPGVEAIAIATPPVTHHEMAMRALAAGKHVLVEKPLAMNVSDALDLIEYAEAAERVLMPGHTFVYSASVNAVRDLIREGVLGEVYFVTSSRMNLGKYQQDGVVRDLAPHDLSILLYWLDERVIQVSATAQSIFQTGVAETAFMTLTFESGTTANVQISWLAPRKVRQMIVVGSRRMVQYDDTASDEPVRLYDRGLDFESPPASYGEYQLTYRTGDVVIPRIDAVEPLGLELSDFAHSIRNSTEPRSTPRLGLEIAAILEATDLSLERGGEPIMVPHAVAQSTR